MMGSIKTEYMFSFISVFLTSLKILRKSINCIFYFKRWLVLVTFCYDHILIGKSNTLGKEINDFIFLTVFKVAVDKILDKSIGSRMPRIWSKDLYIWEKSRSCIDDSKYSFTSNRNWISISIIPKLILNDFNFSIFMQLQAFRVETSVSIPTNGRAYVKSCGLSVEPDSWDSLTNFAFVSTSCEMNNITPPINNALWKYLERDVPCWSKRWYHILQMVLCQFRTYG